MYTYDAMTNLTHSERYACKCVYESASMPLPLKKKVMLLMVNHLRETVNEMAKDPKNFLKSGEPKGDLSVLRRAVRELSELYRSLK